MDLLKLVGLVETTDAFKDLKDARLAHFFFAEEGVDVGFYLPSEDRLASFLVSGEKVEFRGVSFSIEQ